MQANQVSHTTNCPGKAMTGFAMVELLIVVTVVAILVSVAMPSYQRVIVKSRQTEAKELLYTAAHRQQQFFTRNNVYTTVTGEAGINVPTTSGGGYYTLTITVPIPASSYSMSAVPVPDTSQASDSECGTFTLNSLGVKTVSGSQTSPPCW